MARKGGKDRGLFERLHHGEKRWFARFTHGGKELAPFGPFANKTEARDFYTKAKADQGRGVFFPEQYRHATRPTLIKGEPVEAVIAAHLKRPDMVKKKDRRMDLQYSKWWTEQCAGKGMGDLTKQFFQEVITALEEKEKAPQTIYNHLQFMRHLTNCYLQEHDMKNPFQGVIIPHADPRGRVTFLEYDEEPALLQALGPYAPYATIFLKTGLRRSELILRPWTDVDLARRFFALPNPKAGQLQYQPFTKVCGDVIARLPSRLRSPWVCPSISDPNKAMDPGTFYHEVWEPAIKKAHLTERGITIHTLRHTFASRLAMKGAADGTIATLLRHSTTSLVKRYAHLRPSFLTGVLEGLDMALESPESALERMEQTG